MLARGWPTARVILVMLAVVTAACEPEGLARLELIEEGGIAYPNSTALANGGYEAELTLEGPQPAAVWSIYGTDAPAAEVIQFYADELRALGWEEATGVPSTSEIGAHGWRRDDVALRLGIKDVEEWHQRIEGSDAYPTLYEISLTDLRDIGD